MDIKKIIKEEINDFQWMEDVPIGVRITDIDQLNVGDGVRITSDYDDIKAVDDIGVIDYVDEYEYMIRFTEKTGTDLHGEHHGGKLHDGNRNDMVHDSWFFNPNNLNVDKLYKIS